ncbi:MAG TPA: hypothetical protein VGB37_09215 [Candidatus Lokiarchaeia archaeon]
MASKRLTKDELEEIKNVKVGKWDIISEYHRIDWLKQGFSEEEAKIHGIVIAIVGYQARLGQKTQKYTIEQKGKERGVSITHRQKEKWITSKEFDKVINKITKRYYKDIFSPAIEILYNKGYSYDDVKKAVDIPSKIGAKISLEKFLQFLE